MQFKFVHNNFNVLDLDKSLAFYKQALGLEEIRRNEAEDGSFILFYLGDNEFHLAFEVEDYEAAHKLHEEMGCICFENEKMGIYFIIDPDNYWLEILPAKR